MTAANKPTIHERMCAILADLPPIGKDQKNAQQNFMFRGHDDVLNALNPLLAKHGVFVVPHVLGRETSQRTTAKGSVMFEVSLLVEYAFYGAEGDSVLASAWGEGTDMGDKATSKAMTMAFKSVLNQAFAISNKEFADPDAHTPDESSRPAAAPEQHSVKAPERLTADTLEEFGGLARSWAKMHPEFDADKAVAQAAGKDAGWVDRASQRLRDNIAEKIAAQNSEKAAA